MKLKLVNSLKTSYAEAYIHGQYCTADFICSFLDDPFDIWIYGDHVLLLSAVDIIDENGIEYAYALIAKTKDYLDHLDDLGLERAHNEHENPLMENMIQVVERFYSSFKAFKHEA